MEFEETVAAAIAEGWQEVEAERQADSAFVNGWSETRKMVHQVLASAKRPLESGKLGGAWAKQENGCNVLIAEMSPISERETGNQLQFCVERSSRRIVCRTKPANLMEEESFTLDALTAEVVEQKVLEFVRALMAQHRPKFK
jgi:hypothetical protein